MLNFVLDRFFSSTLFPSPSALFPLRLSSLTVVHQSVAMSRTTTVEPTVEDDHVVDETAQYFEEIDKLTELAIAAADIKKYVTHLRFASASVFSSAHPPNPAYCTTE